MDPLFWKKIRNKLKNFWRYIMLVILLGGNLSVGKAQERFTSFTEPFISLKYKATKNYTAQFHLGNRNYLYQDQNYTYKVQLLDLTHISTFILAQKSELGVGARYRIGNRFNLDAEEEFRFIQFLKWRFPKTSFLQQRMQLEQRIIKNIIKFRTRFALQVTLPIPNKSLLSMDFIKIITESLWQLSPINEPDLEQRLGCVPGWNIKSHLKLETGVQYRLKNYTQNIGHQLFAILGVRVSI